MKATHKETHIFSPKIEYLKWFWALWKLSEVAAIIFAFMLKWGKKNEQMFRRKTKESA